MKLFLIIFQLVVFSALSAQSQQLYVKIGFDHKTDFSSTIAKDRVGLITDFDNLFDFQTKTNSSVFTGLNFGFNAGILLANNDRVELGLTQDEANVAFNALFNGAKLNASDSYIKREKILLANKKFLAMQIRYLSQIGETNNYIITGLQLSLSKDHSIPRYSEKIEHDANTSIIVSEKPGYNQANSLFLTLGFEHNLTIKKVYWCSLSVQGNISINNNVIGYRNSTVSVARGNEWSSYSFVTTSRGTGLLVQISRVFDFGKR